MSNGLTTINVPGVGRRRMGLLRPIRNVSSLTRYALAGPMWGEAEALRTIEDRQPRREIFGDDWIKDQNGIGACAGYAGASLVERTRHRAGHTHVPLSGDGVYAACNGGRDGGAQLETVMRWLGSNGPPPESLVDRHQWRKSRIPKAAFDAGARFKGLEGYFLETEMELASALANDFFVALAVHAGNGGRSPDGMIAWQHGPGNHSVVSDDLRHRGGQFEFEIANSWGLRWGERGRGFVSWRGHLTGPLRYHKFYAFRAAAADPEGDNPPKPKG